MLLVLSLSIFLNSNTSISFAKTHPGLPQKETEELDVSASLAKKEWVTPTELIGLRFGRPLEASEGTLAVFVGQTGMFEVKPSLTLNLEAESTVLFFPDSSRPDRINYTDFAFQGGLGTNLARGKFNHQSQFDLVGTTVQKEALRFGEKAKDAPQLDLSSYVMNFQVKKVKVVLGHHSYGTNRYLINGFSSRGLDVTVPFGSRFDLSFNATNGTSIVGWNNFSGLSKQKHKIFAGTLGYEIFPKHPGWLRLEAGVLHGSLLPLNNYNQRNLTDAKTSNGVGARIVATDSKGRLRVDAGYGRSRFDNPVDPLLSQGFSIFPVRESTRDARYLDLSYQILKFHELNT
jgi:hypothetical protein